MIVWRISEFTDLSGLGGKLADGRWHKKGKPIIYCAESAAGAMLEILAHTNVNNLPESVQYLQIEIGNNCLESVENMSDMKLCQNFGSQWLAQKTSLMMRVPSVLAPQTYNILINPVHISMKDVQIVSIIRYPFDKRLN